MKRTTASGRGSTFAQPMHHLFYTSLRSQLFFVVFLSALVCRAQHRADLAAADSLYQRERFAEALSHYQRILRTAEAQGDSSTLAYTNCMIGVIHGRSGSGSLATNYLRNAVLLAKDLHDTTLLIRCLKGLGNVQEMTADHVQARLFYQEAMLVARSAHDKVAELQLLNNIGVTCTKSGELEMAVGHLRNALAIAQQLNDSICMVMTLSNLGNNLVAQGKARESLGMLDRALGIARATGGVDDEATIHSQRADAYHQLGELQSAYDEMQRFHALDDSIASARNTARMAELETDHQLELKRMQLVQAQAESEKGALKLEAELARTGRQRWIIALIGLLATTALVGLYHVWRRAHTIRKLNTELASNLDENEQLRAMIKQDLDHYRSIALRKQLNPHFVSNCLSGIQGAILHDDKRTASLRLARFSRLIRRLLDQAEHDLVPVADELGSMDMYVELEAARFHDGFQWERQDQSGCDLARYRMPPMLLQPHIENAIHHGLIPRTGGRKLSLVIDRSGDVLRFNITDNGIGRAAAGSRKANGTGTHYALGELITAQRMDLLRGMYGPSVSHTVHDLRDANGEPCGTRVEITMPLIPMEA